MTNKYRGCIAQDFNGFSYNLCLTLGALAELEEALNCQNISCLFKKFQEGYFSTQDIIKILGIALRAGGSDIQDKDIHKWPLDRGFLIYVNTVSRLLQETFFLDIHDKKETQENPYMP